ncbi:transketolase family protein [Desulfosporosinus sp. FKA]|uniref:transketolase family protein n=1 Tax=Desulfosporosinus sp. FKA TaxID=1969834 RepID=UPI000B49A4F6|nr:transketolase family protein [Desulfosporosinus sp. FKA]
MTKIAPRQAYGEELVRLGQENPDIVVLDADVAKASMTYLFKEKFPERFFDLGISESDIVGTGAGFAVAGKIPFINAYANFLLGNGWEEIHISIAYANQNVKIVGHNIGASSGKDGPTHLPFEDIALMRVLPGIMIVEPADAIEMRKAVRAAAQHQGPVYLRVGRLPIPLVTCEEDPFELGKARILREGQDVTVIATGAMVAKGLEAAEELASLGISAEVINLHTIKPLDEETLLRSVRKTGAVVTAEEHTILGGMGSAVAELLVEEFPVPLQRVGVKDRFAVCAPYDELHDILGLTAKTIIKSVQDVIRKKRQ